MDCAHENFAAAVDVNRIVRADGGMDFTADLSVVCADCGRPMQFLGLPIGLNMRGAAMTPDGLQARLALIPEGEAPTPLELLGFEIRGARPAGGIQ